MIKKIYIVLLLSLLAGTTAFAQKDYEGYVKDALDYTDKKDYAAAEQAYKAALRLESANPGNILLMMNLGTIQRYLGKYEEALISYDIVVQHKPSLDYILNSRARLYCDMNRYEDALKDYTTIILHYPANMDALYDRGLVYITLRRLDEAEGDFNSILLKDETNRKAKMGLAMIMKRRGQWKEAEQLYSDLISEERGNGELYANRAECYLNLKRLRSMGDDLDRAVEYGYDDYSIHILKGQLKLEQFEKDIAREEFEKAVEKGADRELVEDFLLLCK